MASPIPHGRLGRVAKWGRGEYVWCVEEVESETGGVI